MHSPLCPSLYQINTRVWLSGLSHALGGAPPWTTFRMPSSIASPRWASTGSGSSACGRPVLQGNGSPGPTRSGAEKFLRLEYDVATVAEATRASELPNEFADDIERGGAPTLAAK